MRHFKKFYFAVFLFLNFFVNLEKGDQEKSCRFDRKLQLSSYHFFPKFTKNVKNRKSAIYQLAAPNNYNTPRGCLTVSRKVRFIPPYRPKPPDPSCAPHRPIWQVKQRWAKRDKSSTT